MIYNPSVISHLKGSDFSSSLIVNISKKKHPPLRREVIIKDIVKNKKVVHIGCADHVNLIEKKREQGIWLHEMICNSASRCVGIDINQEGINYMKNNLMIKDVYCADITSDLINPILEEKWDYIILGEIIEHLDNPVSFLKQIHDVYCNNFDRFIVTVPSIFSIRRFHDILKYREVINSDHRFWFTPYTISKILFSAGFTPEEINYANLGKLSLIERLKRITKRLFGIKVLFPYYFFNNLVITGRF